MKIHGGFIQCIFRIAGTAPHNSFYEDDQTHTWEIGSSPTVTNALQQFPGATWFVAGSGDLRDDNGVGTVRTAQWFRIFKPEQMIVQVRLSGNMIIVGANNTSVSAPGAIHYHQQQTINGQPQTPGASKFPATPIAWPTIQWDTGHTSPFSERLEQPAPHTLPGQSQPSFGPQQPGYAKIGKAFFWRIQFSFS